MQDILDISQQLANTGFGNPNEPQGLRDYFETAGYDVGWDDKTGKTTINGKEIDTSGFDLINDRFVGTLQQMQERGTLDSGIAAQAQLQAGQQASNLLAQQAESQAAQAAAARRAAIGQQANMATQMQQQGLQLAGQKASAKDVINQFNVQNRQNVAARNLAERQRIAEAGTATANQQQLYNTGLIQQQFQNEVARAGGINTANQNLAGLYSSQAQAAQQAQQAGTGAALNLAGTLAAAAIKSGA
jgi:hypothetical protein